MGVGSWLSFRLALRLVKDERIYPFAIAVVIGGLAAARIGHIADNWPYYGGHPDQLLAFWNGGVAATAAPVGSAISGWIAAKRRRLPGADLDPAARPGRLRRAPGGPAPRGRLRPRRRAGARLGPPPGGRPRALDQLFGPSAADFRILDNAAERHKGLPTGRTGGY